MFIKRYLLLGLCPLLLSANTLHVEKGWSLVGESEGVDFAKDFSSAKIIWSYDNVHKSWRYFTTDEGLKDKLTSYEKVDSIGKHSAFWIYSDENSTIDYTPIHSTYRGYKSVDLADGWNLVGSTFSTNLPATFHDKNVKIVWNYNNDKKEWEFYSSNATLTSKMKKSYAYIDSINPQKGFWVYVKGDRTLLLQPKINSHLITTITNTTHPYRAVKLEYPLHVKDKTVIASALLSIPLVSDSNLSLICDEHGTYFNNERVPTNKEQNNSVYYPNANKISGSNKFIGIFPDYLGYGSSHKKVAHPYIIAHENAMDAYSAIEAALEYLQENNISYNKENLFVTGYSEGGYNAMATAKEIEESNATNQNFTLKAFAPMAGPYDIQKMAENALKVDYTMPYPAILGYIAFSYGAYYDENLTKILNSTNTNEAEVTTLYTNLNDSLYGVSINKALLNATGLFDLGVANHKSSDLFKSSFLTAYSNGSSVDEVKNLKSAFHANNIYDWKPKTKVNLVQCSDDDIIPYSMSEEAYNKFVANGSDVTLTPLTSTTDLTHPSHHLNCEPKAYDKAIEWFKSLE